MEDFNFEQRDDRQDTMHAEPAVNYNVEDFYAQKWDKPAKAPKLRKKGKWGKVILSGILMVALVAGGCVATAMYVNHIWEQKNTQYYLSVNQTIAGLHKELETAKQEAGAMSGLSGAEDASPADGFMTPAQIYAQNVGAVVAISNQGLSTNIFGQVSQMASSGSGFIISEDGYVATNYHVIQGANKLMVITADGEEYSAAVVGYDAGNDIAVLKIEAAGLPYVKLGSSDELVVGDRVAAIGNPLGELTSTLTVGYVSAKDRSINTDGTSMNMLQTDAAINSGNSGGPLFNMKGEVVGITTAKYSGTSDSGATIEGIGFAIPMDDVAAMIEDLIEKGYVSGAYLGVVVLDVTAEDAQKYGLPLGALVQEVSTGFAAERAGVQARDIIVDVGGRPVSSVAELTKALRNYEAGQQTVITVYRSGERKVLPVTLDERPNDTEATLEQNVQPTQPQTEQNVDPFDSFQEFFWPFFG